MIKAGPARGPAGTVESQSCLIKKFHNNVANSTTGYVASRRPSLLGPDVDVCLCVTLFSFRGLYHQTSNIHSRKTAIK